MVHRKAGTEPRPTRPSLRSNTAEKITIRFQHERGVALPHLAVYREIVGHTFWNAVFVLIYMRLPCRVDQGNRM